LSATKNALIAIVLAAATGSTVWAQLAGSDAATSDGASANARAAGAPVLPAPVLDPAAKKAPPSKEELEYLAADADFHAHNYQRAFLELLPLAHRGEARAEYLMGVMADNGLGPVQLQVTDAAQWYRRAADKNNSDAQFALSNAYAIGRGVPVDAQQALAWLQRAANNNHVPAMMAMAGLLDSGAGGVERNPEEAAAWIKRAAEQGSVNATYLYGERFAKGLGVPKDEKQAIAWYERAALRGHPAAQLALGRLVGDGLNATSAQNVEAFMWLTLASQRGEGQVRIDAGQLRRALQSNMMPTDVTEATTRSRAWKPAPQLAGLKPDPDFDLPGGLNNPAPPKPPATAAGGRGGAAGGGKGG
jgi:TPR repeat protein